MHLCDSESEVCISELFFQEHSIGPKGLSGEMGVAARCHRGLGTKQGLVMKIIQELWNRDV